MSSWRTYFPDGIPDDPDEQRRLVSELTDEMCLKDMSTRLAHAQLKEPANKRVLLTIDFQLYGLCIHGPSLRREINCPYDLADLMDQPSNRLSLEQIGNLILREKQRCVFKLLLNARRLRVAYSNRFITAFDLPLELATAAGGRLDQKQQASASVEKGKKPVVCVIAGDHPFYFDYHPELVDQTLKGSVQISDETGLATQWTTEPNNNNTATDSGSSTTQSTLEKKKDGATAGASSSGGN